MYNVKTNTSLDKRHEMFGLSDERADEILDCFEKGSIKQAQEAKHDTGESDSIALATDVANSLAANDTELAFIFYMAGFVTGGLKAIM